MLCERCNIDFPEGLRYCKWCGETLHERKRDTSELYTCPACSSQVRQGWVFCKSCGARLNLGGPHQQTEIFCPRCGNKASTAALNCQRCGEDLTQPVSPQQGAEDTSKGRATGTCWSCSEPLEPNSLYCKACGSAVYAGPTIAHEGGGLLCSTCKSVSPVGSFNCRVCGAPLTAALGADASNTSGAETKVHSVPPGIDHESSTIPDLGEHLEALRRAPTRDDMPTLQTPAPPFAEIDSGAHTFILGTDEPPRRERTTDELASEHAEQKSEPPPLVSQTEAFSPAIKVEIPPLNLPPEPSEPDGEQTQLTKNIKKTRITSPVDGETTTTIEREDIDRAQALLAGEKPPTTTVPSVDAGPGQPATLALPSEQAPPPTRQAGVPRRTAEQGSLSPAAQPRPIAATQPRPRPQTQPKPFKQPAAKKPVSTVLSVIVVVVVLAATGFVLWWFLFRGNKPRQAPPQVQVEVPVPTPAPKNPPPPVEPPAPEGMLKVAAGTYTIGRDTGDPAGLDQPAHSTQVSAFFIDRTEVTNAQYKKFIDATGHPAPVVWKNGSYPAGDDRLPITEVTWQDASDYAEWAGKRLPTESEWEAAARGADGRTYPWGNEWRPGIANIGAKTGKIEEVGKYPDSASPFGALDMIGNVWEWTADDISAYPGSHATPVTEPRINYRVIRGGAYDGDRRHDASYRGYLDASKPYPKVGFRCVKDAK